MTREVVDVHHDHLVGAVEEGPNTEPDQRSISHEIKVVGQSLLLDPVVEVGHLVEDLAVRARLSVLAEVGRHHLPAGPPNHSEANACQVQLPRDKANMEHECADLVRFVLYAFSSFDWKKSCFVPEIIELSVSV